MTMRLDIVTNDAGELVRREHARELGAGVVVAIYRLVKLAMMHDLGNQAFIRQLEQTHQMVGEYCLRSGSNLSVLFANKATFVAGQLLKGSRSTYENASELGSFLEKLGGSELHIARDITREELHQFAEQVSLYHRTGNASQVRFPPKIHLRQVADAARLRGIELEDLTSEQRIVRAYASAVVIMRRFFEDLSASRYVLPRRIKRIAQSLVDLSDASAAAFLGVTEVRNANFDEAGRAVNTAILAVSIARETTQDRTTLAQIAMAAMMHDVARPRALALAGAGGSPMPGMAGPSTLSEDQEDRLAAGAAAVLTALGRVNEPSITRTVLTFEALWLRRKTWLGPVYWGSRPPTLHASIIAVARRYNDLLTPEPGLQPPTTDFAVASLANELTEPQDRTVLRMLVSALGLLPTGTVVQLATGEVAEVVRGSKGLGEKPRVVILADPNGAQYPQPMELELSQDPRRSVHRILSVDGWRKGLAQGPEAPGPGPESDEDVVVSVPPPQPTHTEQPAPMPAHAMPPPAAPAQVSPLSPVLNASRSIADKYADQYASWGSDANNPNAGPEQTGRGDSSASGEHPASASMPSLGSSPSAVAEAMGRMINDSLRPPAMPPREANSPDRTLYQPQQGDGPPQPRVTSTPSREPTARGNLAATPLPHVLVYMLDHSLTGSVVFEGTNANGSDDTVYFVHGVPAKIRLGDTVALLGEVLVEDGSIDQRAVEQAVEGARRLGILLGEYLVGHDLVTRDALAWGLEGQLLRKIAHVANLAPEIQYAYYRDVDLLEGWGGDVTVSHPLNPILASVRHWHDRARVRATLNRIGKHPLTLHSDSDLTNIAVITEEQTVLDAIRAEAMPLPQLFKQKLADDEVVSSLVYSLAVTRQFSFKGQKKGPMAARGAAWRSMNPSSSSSPSPHLEASSSERRAMTASASGQIALGSASGSRPIPTAKPMAAAASMPAPPPPPPPAPQAPPPSRIGPPSAQMRAALPVPPTAQIGAPPPTPRAIAPAARPPGVGPASSRATGPQIRQVVKKSSGTGLGAPPPTAPPSSNRNPVASPQPPQDPASDGKNEGMASNPPGGRPSSPPDDAKTIAVASPAIKELLKKQGLQPPGGAGARPNPSASKPTPPLPTSRNPMPPNAKSSGINLPPNAKTSSTNAAGAVPPNAKASVTGPIAPAPIGGSAPEEATKKISKELIAQAREALASAPPSQGGPALPPKTQGTNPKLQPPPQKPPASPTSTAKLASAKITPPAAAPSTDIAIELDEGAGPMNAIEIGDDGLSEAEAALEAMSSFRLAEGAVQRNDLKAAEEHAKKAVAGDPTQPDYVSLLAWIRAQTSPQTIDEAIRTMSKVLIEDPSNERALFYRGKLLVKTNRFPEALNDFNELLSSNPNHREAQNEVRQLKTKVPSS